ncbi:zinc ribbon domain-containing protein [Porcipelethomonas sp.]|uniref:zinc ribbon domain-containing protein n=1 Tax=Porcipelethomonas sp. TaxID=2981675 RepID=UPI003EF5CBE3
MSVFKNIGKSISNKSKEISQKAKIMSETSSLNNIIKGEECKIDSQYKLIGKMYFENYGENPSEEFKPAIDAIKSSIVKIGETKEEIIKIKSRFCCPSCGTPFKNDAIFCSKCGTRLPEKPKGKQPAESKQTICSNCGNILEEGAMFCNICGTKFEEKTDCQDTVNEITVQPDVKETVENIPAPAVAEEKEEEKAVVTEEPVNITEPDTEKSVSEPVENNAAADENTVETIKKVFCPNCKNEVHTDDYFCDSCGEKLK